MAKIDKERLGNMLLESHRKQSSNGLQQPPFICFAAEYNILGYVKDCISKGANVNTEGGEFGKEYFEDSECVVI